MKKHLPGLESNGPLESMNLPHRQIDIATEDFQKLEALATAYWYSEVLFASLELDIFGLLGDKAATVSELVEQCHYDADALGRLLQTLAAMGLLVQHAGRFANSPLAAKYLVPGIASYMGDFLLYRRYLISHWQRLGARVSLGPRANARQEEESPKAYRERTLAYVRAMDLQARLKASEAVPLLSSAWTTPPQRLLDVGGGAGAWCRAFLRQWPQSQAILFDLPEVLSAAFQLYPDPRHWEGIMPLAGNILSPCFQEAAFDVILLSNILHAYGAREAQNIVDLCAGCLRPHGSLIIHDYLVDAHPVDPVKGVLYDLHMLINTYNGRIYSLAEMTTMLQQAGLRHIRCQHLRTDTSILLATADGNPGTTTIADTDWMLAQARQAGFQYAQIMPADQIAVAPWVRLKCRFGCRRYGQSLSCPPAALDDDQMAAVLARYQHALLVQGTPPSARFHEQLLALEKTFFLAGYPEALAFGAGPCPVCPACQTEGPCRFPEKLRPSLEACGVDVYTTARRAGIALQPVQHPHGYVKYIGMVLLGLKDEHADTADPSRFNGCRR